MHFLVYREASSNLWCWTLYNDNRQMLARNVENYYNKEDCRAAIDLIKSSASFPIKEK